MSPELTQSDNDDVHLQSTVAVLKSTVERHEGQWEGVYDRLGKIERLIYLGIGGGTAIGLLATFFGWNILKLLGK
jgi:hypothetical protein